MGNSERKHNDLESRRKYDEWQDDLFNIKTDVIELKTKQAMIEKMLWAILVGILGIFFKSFI